METTTTTPVRLPLTAVELQAMIKERAFEISQLRIEENREGTAEEDWRQAAAEIEAFVAVEPEC